MLRPPCACVLRNRCSDTASAATVGIAAKHRRKPANRCSFPWRSDGAGVKRRQSCDECRVRVLALAACSGIQLYIRELSCVETGSFQFSEETNRYPVYLEECVLKRVTGFRSSALVNDEYNDAIGSQKHHFYRL